MLFSKISFSVQGLAFSPVGKPIWIMSPQTTLDFPHFYPSAFILDRTMSLLVLGELTFFDEVAMWLAHMKSTMLQNPTLKLHCVFIYGRHLASHHAQIRLLHTICMLI